MPDEQEQVKLVNESTLIFAESIYEKSMTRFHSYVSRLWQEQYTVQKFDEIFGGFYNLDSDLRVLGNYSPIFENRPTLDEDGVMLITGFYPTKPQQFYFEQSYIYEGMSWKLVGFSANIR